MHISVPIYNAICFLYSFQKVSYYIGGELTMICILYNYYYDIIYTIYLPGTIILKYSLRKKTSITVLVRTQNKQKKTIR